MDCRYTFDPMLQGFSRKPFEFDHQFGFSLFCFKDFLFFLSELTSNSAIMESNTSMLNSFLAPISIIHWLSQNLTKEICFIRSPLVRWPLFLHFSSVLFYFIFSLSFLYFLIYMCFFQKIKQQLKVQFLSLCCRNLLNDKSPRVSRKHSL